MNKVSEDVYTGVKNWASARGIRVHETPLPVGQAGEFNGLAVKMNPQYECEERVYYLAHAL